MKNTLAALILVSITFLQGCDNLFINNLYEKVKVDVYRNSIIIPIIINGKSYNFQLDTGAPTCLSEELFSTLGLQAKDTLHALDYYDNHKLVKTSILSKIQIGSVKFRNVKVSIIRPVQDLMFCNVKIDGYLGSDFFADKILLIDIRKSEIIITNRLQKLNLDKKYAVKINLHGVQKTPKLPIFFTSKNGEYVLFDTGSTNDLYRLRTSVLGEMLKDSIITDHDILYTDKNIGSGLFGPQNDSINYNVSFDSLKVCNTFILNCIATTFTAGNSLLGAPILQNGIVSIDYINRYFYFNPYGETPINLKSKHGLFSIYKDQKIYTEFVIPGSIGDLNGIKKGYILKQINSIVFDSLSKCEILNLNLSSEISKPVVEYIFEYENKKIPITINN